MGKTQLALTAALLAILAILPGCRDSAAITASEIPTGYHVGDLAPGFDLFNLSGQKVSLGSYLGRPVMVNFWATD